MGAAVVVGKIDGRNIGKVDGKLVFLDTGKPINQVVAPAAELEDDDRLGSTDRVTPEGVQSSGTNMGKMSLERADALTPGFQMGNLANYFGTRPASSTQTGESVSDLEFMGASRRSCCSC